MAMAAETPNTEAMGQVLLPAPPSEKRPSVSWAPPRENNQESAPNPNDEESAQPPRESFQQRGVASFNTEQDVQVDTIAQPSARSIPQPSSHSLAWVPEPMQGVANFCRQFWTRVLQLAMYTAFVAPPSILTGLLCSALLYCIKLATAVRNGTCGDYRVETEEGTYYEALLNTDQPLAACEDVQNANRWLLFLLSFSGLFVQALYTYLGNANASGGFNTILKGCHKLEEEIDCMVNEQRRREAEARSLAEPGSTEDFQGLVALRMCPLVFIGTVSTHLTGGAAGREGSALQIAASIFSKYCDFLDATLGRAFPYCILTVQMRRSALVAAIAAGFSGIFGVPVTGTIFAVEVLRVGELTLGEMLQPAVVGAFFADWACRLCSEDILEFGSHSKYNCTSCQAGGTPQNWFEPTTKAGLELLAVIPAAFAFGLCGYAFEWLLHHFKHIFGEIAGKVSRGNPKAKALLTPFIGGWVVVLMWLVLCVFGTTSSFNISSTYDGTDKKSSTFAQAYLGLSVYEPGVSISSCFVNSTLNDGKWPGGPLAGTPVQPIMWYSFLLKLLFTTVTLGAGFKGGEVTPIFFIGGALGNICGVVLRQDTQLFAALGLVSVFAAAANTPIACTFMAIELFGGAKALPYLLSCYLAYLVSNTVKVNGIYAAQDEPRGGTVVLTPFSRRRPHRV